MSLSREDEARIEAAIRDCERATGGQIVCVHAQSAMVQRTALPVLAAALVAIVVPWLLIAVTRWPVQTILLVQAVAFVALLALGMLPVVERALMPAALRRAMAWRLAAEQFVVRGVSRTPDRSGILIFVAEAERYARVIADEGIARHVPEARWQAAVQPLVTHMKQEQAADGFVAAIAVCTEILKTYRGTTAQGGNALPDRVYQI